MKINLTAGNSHWDNQQLSRKFMDIIKKGEGMSLKYLDQLSNEEIWVSRSYIKRYLRKTYNLSEQEYYNIVVFGDKDYIPKCKFCGRDRKFWRLRDGYYSTCASEECRAMRSSEYNKYRWDTLKGEERNEFKSKLGFGSPRTGLLCRAKAEYFRLANNLDPSLTYHLYIAVSKDNRYKFGLSSNLDGRKHRMKYKSIKSLITGTLEYISKLEYLIKINMPSHSEYFSESELELFKSIYKESVIKAKDFSW